MNIVTFYLVRMSFIKSRANTHSAQEHMHTKSRPHTLLPFFSLCLTLEQTSEY